jgi:hypothetical protein
MKYCHLLLVMAAALFSSCTSCLPPLVSFARFESPMKPDFGLGTNTNTAVVYGRFETGPGFAFDNEIALRFRDQQTHREYLIRCVDKDSVYAIAVESGRYSVAGFVATFLERRTAGKRRFQNPPVLDVPAGGVTYIGDYKCDVSTAFASQTWGVRQVHINFEATTEEFKTKYPNVASVGPHSAFPTPVPGPGTNGPSLETQRAEK